MGRQTPHQLNFVLASVFEVQTPSRPISSMLTCVSGRVGDQKHRQLNFVVSSLFDGQTPSQTICWDQAAVEGVKQKIYQYKCVFFKQLSGARHTLTINTKARLHSYDLHL